MTKDKKNDEKLLHCGHRERLVNLAANAGLDAMSDIQVMELLLTYIFPRGDVNPLAHRLLNEFESFAKIIETEPFELMRVKGINKRSATMISLLNEFFFYYVTERLKKRPKIDTLKDLVDAVEDCIRFKTTEHVLFLAFSSNNVLTHKRLIKSKETNEVGFDMADLTNFVSNSNPVSLAIAHCHPFGVSVPSPADKSGLETVRKFCESVGVNMIDSFIVGEDGVFSQLKQEMLRTYKDVEELQGTIQVIVNNAKK